MVVAFDRIGSFLCDSFILWWYPANYGFCPSIHVLKFQSTKVPKRLSSQSQVCKFPSAQVSGNFGIWKLGNFGTLLHDYFGISVHGCLLGHLGTWVNEYLGTCAFRQLGFWVNTLLLKIKFYITKSGIYWCSHVIHSFFDGIPQIMDFVVGVWHFSGGFFYLTELMMTPAHKRREGSFVVVVKITNCIQMQPLLDSSMFLGDCIHQIDHCIPAGHR